MTKTIRINKATRPRLADWVVMLSSTFQTVVAGNAEYRSPASFVFSPYVVNIFGWAFADPVMCFGEKLIAISEDGRLLWARLGTRRLAASRNPVVAENAFAHIRNRGLPLIAGNTIWARHHAVPASHALAALIYNGSKLCLMEGADGTSRGTSRLKAVSALFADKRVLRTLNYRGPILSRKTVIEVPPARQVHGQLVLLLAGDHTLVAVVALRSIGKDGHLHLLSTLPCTAVAISSLAFGNHVGLSA